MTLLKLRKICTTNEKEGADLVVAIPHSGFSQEPYKAMAENSVYYLSEVPGIDAIMFGHSHGVFPSKDFSDIKGVDIAKEQLMVYLRLCQDSGVII